MTRHGRDRRVPKRRRWRGAWAATISLCSALLVAPAALADSTATSSTATDSATGSYAADATDADAQADADSAAGELALVLRVDGEELTVVEVANASELTTHHASAAGPPDGSPEGVVEALPALVVSGWGSVGVTTASIDHRPLVIDAVRPDGTLRSEVFEPETRELLVPLADGLVPRRLSVLLAPGTVATVDPADLARAASDSTALAPELDEGDEGSVEPDVGDAPTGEEATRWPSVTLHAGGPSDAAVDIVILGDGYIDTELGAFAADAQGVAEHLLAQQPFAAMSQYLNIHRVDVPSAESGTDNTCTGETRDTAFDTGFRRTGVDCRALFSTSTAKISAAAASAPSADTVVVLVNSDTYGGAAFLGGHAFSTTGIWGEEIAIHEFGHSFGLLADEYSGFGAAPIRLSYPNVSTSALRSSLPWQEWVSAATQLPTVDSSGGVPGAFQGAAGFGTGAYRPTFNSKMRSLSLTANGNPFEIVNEALLARRILAHVPEDPTPPIVAGTVIALDTERRRAVLRVEYADPESLVSGFAASFDEGFDGVALRPAGFVSDGAANVELTWPETAATPVATHLRAQSGGGVRTHVEVPLRAMVSDVGVVDLAVGAVRFGTVEESAAPSVEITLRNRGTAASPAGTAHVVVVLVDGVEVLRLDRYVDSIAPADAVVLSAPVPGWLPVAGTATVTVIVDPDDLIPGERRQVNNERRLRVTVAGGDPVAPTTEPVDAGGDPSGVSARRPTPSE